MANGNHQYVKSIKKFRKAYNLCKINQQLPNSSQ